MKNSVKEPEILKSELDTSATEPKQEQFKSRLEVTDQDVEQVAGGVTPYCSVVL